MEVEKWDWKDWRNWVAIAVWVLLPLSVFLGLVPGWAATWDWLGKNSSNIAVWVQAIVSTCLIATGFAVAKFQIKENVTQQLAKEKRDELNMMFKQKILMIDAYEASINWAQKLLNAVSERFSPWDATLAESEGVYKTLLSINRADLLDPIDVVLLTSTIKRVERIRIWLKLSDKNTTQERSFIFLEDKLDEIINESINNKILAINSVREVSDFEQHKSLDMFIELLEKKGKRDVMRLSPSGIASPEIPQPQVAVQQPNPGP